MTPAITLEELLAWNHESSNFWKTYFDANPALLELPCDISGITNVKEFVCHIWGVELVWGQRISGGPVMDRKEVPTGSLDKLFELHLKAVQIYRAMLDDPAQNWDETQTLKTPWLPPEGLTVSRRKLTAFALFHSQRHWAQLATLIRVAGFPSGFKGDLLFSSALV
jgi:uncharacterized damage-inducible protein DinB